MYSIIVRILFRKAVYINGLSVCWGIVYLTFFLKRFTGSVLQYTYTLKFFEELRL